MDNEAEEEALGVETVHEVSVSGSLSSCCAGAWRATSATDLCVRSAIDSPFDNEASVSYTHLTLPTNREV